MLKGKKITLYLAISITFVIAVILLVYPRKSISPNGKITMKVVDIYDITDHRSIIGITFKNETDEWITFGNTPSSSSYSFQWFRQLIGSKTHKPPSVFNGYRKTNSLYGWSGTQLGKTEHHYPYDILHTLSPHSQITIYTEIYNFNFLLDDNAIEAITYGFTYFKYGRQVDDTSYHMLVSEPIPEEILRKYPNYNAQKTSYSRQ